MINSLSSFRDKINTYFEQDATIEGNTLKWNKIPKIFRFSACLCSLTITGGTISVALGVVRSNVTQIVCGNVVITLGTLGFVANIIATIKRYHKLSKIEKEIERGVEEVVTLKDEISKEVTPQIEMIFSEDDKSSFMKLPAELLCHIFRFLSAKELQTASQTCKRLYILSKEDSLWSSLIQKDYPVDTDRHFGFQKYRELTLSKKYDLSQKETKISQLKTTFIEKDKKVVF